MHRAVVLLQFVGEGRVGLKLYVQGQRGGTISYVDGQGGRGPENYTFFMDVVCVSSLIYWMYKKVLAIKKKNLLVTKHLTLKTTMSLSNFTSEILTFL